MLGVFAQRRVALPQGDDVPAIFGRADVQWQQGPEPPQIASSRVVPRKIRLLVLKSLKIEHDLHRARVERIQIHELFGRVLVA